MQEEASNVLGIRAANEAVLDQEGDALTHPEQAKGQPFSSSSKWVSRKRRPYTLRLEVELLDALEQGRLAQLGTLEPARVVSGGTIRRVDAAVEPLRARGSREARSTVVEPRRESAVALTVL